MARYFLLLASLAAAAAQSCDTDALASCREANPGSPATDCIARQYDMACLRSASCLTEFGEAECKLFYEFNGAQCSETLNEICFENSSPLTSPCATAHPFERVCSWAEDLMTCKREADSIVSYDYRSCQDYMAFDTCGGTSGTECAVFDWNVFQYATPPSDSSCNVAAFNECTNTLFRGACNAATIVKECRDANDCWDDDIVAFCRAAVPTLECDESVDELCAEGTPEDDAASAVHLSPLLALLLPLAAGASMMM